MIFRYFQGIYLYPYFKPDKNRDNEEKEEDETITYKYMDSMGREHRTCFDHHFCLLYYDARQDDTNTFGASRLY